MKLKTLVLLILTLWTGIINAASNGPQGLAGLLDQEPGNSHVYQRVNSATHQVATSTEYAPAGSASIPRVSPAAPQAATSTRIREESDYYSSTDEDEQIPAQQQAPRRSNRRKFNTPIFNAIKAIVQDPDIMVHPTYCKGFSTLPEAQQNLLTKEFDEKTFNLAMTLIKLQRAGLVTPTEATKTEYIFLLPKADEYQETLDPFRLDDIKQILEPEIEQKATFDAAAMELMIQNITNGTHLPEEAIHEIHPAYHEQFNRRVAEINQALSGLVAEYIGNLIDKTITMNDLTSDLAENRYLRSLMIKALEEHNQTNPTQQVEHNLTQEAL